MSNAEDFARTKFVASNESVRKEIDAIDVNPPPTGPNGSDDLTGDVPPSEPTPVDTGPYRIEGGRICVAKQTREGPIVVPLCNFSAQVTEETIIDDGVETTRTFQLLGKLENGESLPPARVPASRFSNMNWIAEQWGLKAVPRAGLAIKDQLREGIQRFSPDARRRNVFCHTGWREIDGRWIYLTAGGAVGRDGFEVEFGPELSRYSLPKTADDPIGAVRESLRLLDIAPLTVTIPLWSATFRAPLASICPLDLSLWIEGTTGTMKSTLVALFLCHFGDFERTKLPGAWSSTANQLERRAFLLKDSVFVIDDWAPNALDVREMETKASRLIRSQGNLSGRGRLRSDLSDRPAYAPRGLIVSTGEQHPPGQSILARILLIELERSSVNVPLLTEAQRTATRLPHAMTGYLTWLAPQMDSLPKLLRETFEGTRARVNANGDHLRVPELMAHMWIGFHCGMTYAQEIGACTYSQAEEFRAKAWDALITVGQAQSRLIEGERPSRRFLSVLLVLVSQKRVLLLKKDESSDSLRGDVTLIGWYDNESIYLIPEAGFQSVARFCRETGEPLPVRQGRLLRDLSQQGLSECSAGRHTITARVGGRPRRVLHLKRREIERLLDEKVAIPSE